MTDKTTSFPEKPDLHTKTARPANVGPHDPNKDQHDPKAKGVTPEDYDPGPREKPAAGKPAKVPGTDPRG